MRLTAAEQIAQEIVHMLEAGVIALVPGRIHRDINDALRSEVMPAIVVETGDEPAPEYIVIGEVARSVEIQVTVLASGSNPYGQADAAMLETHDCIMRDRTVGGLAFDVLEGATRRLRDGLAEDMGAVQKTYQVRYRTAETSLEPMLEG